MAETCTTLEPSGYELRSDGGSRIYLYDTDGNKVDWKDPGDEGYDEWAEALGLRTGT